VPSKQSYLYVFDRISGQPIWPIEEPVQQSDVPTEDLADATVPRKPPAYGRPWLGARRPDRLPPAMRRRRSEPQELPRRGDATPPLLG
jgi:quinoprotein glucose dehydrogenase